MKKLLLAALFFCGSVFAQPIEFIVSASPGGPNDTITRKLAKYISEVTDITFVILNRPGAAHTIAYNYVERSQSPILIVSTSEISKHPVINQLTTVANLGNFSIHIFVKNDSKFNSLDDVKLAGSIKPVLFGQSGVNTFSYYGMNIVCQQINCLPVTYKSGAEGIFGVLSEQIDMYALVSYGTRGFFENQNLRSIHQLDNEIFYVTLFSKNINPDTLFKITAALNQLNQTFYKDLGLNIK